MAGRSPNSHLLKKRAFPFPARLRREEPFRRTDDAEWRAAADRIAGGPGRWYSWAGWAPTDVGFKLIGFSTEAEAEAMQQWIAESRIEARPAPEPYRGPQLTVAGAKPA